MVRTFYERLPVESAALLAAETSRATAHSTTLLVFEAGPLGHAGGGVDFGAIRGAVEARLAAVPRARQRLRRVPLENHPVWVDDPDFNLEYHVRHTSVPRPGDADQLRRMVARIHAQRLDRSRPLWECWVLEGLAGEGFALLWKTHHAMIDAASGPDLLETLLSVDPDAPAPAAASYRPRPVPSAWELVRDEVVRQARIPRRGVEGLLRVVRRPETLQHELEARAREIARLLGYTMRPRSDTPLSGPVGPHRRFDRLVLPLADARRVQRALGGTVHDVLLAVLAGAVHHFFRERLVNPATVDFRVSTPVVLDDPAARDAGREEVGEWIVELPVWERDPTERMARIRSQTRALRAAAPVRGARALADTPRWTGSRRLALGARAVSRRLPIDLALVDVPGPQAPLFLGGARLLEAFGLAPLRGDQALSVTVLSYDGRLCWGLDADFDRLPDLERFTAALERSSDELLRAVEASPRLALVRDA